MFNILIVDFIICSVDINECTTGLFPCDSNANCANNLGSYTCTCKTGFTGDGKTCTGK